MSEVERLNKEYKLWRLSRWEIVYASGSDQNSQV